MAQRRRRGIELLREGYAPLEVALHEHAPNARDFTQRKGHRYYSLTDPDRQRNRTKSKVRAKDDHLFHVLKRQFH